MTKRRHRRRREYMSVNELAARWGVSETTVRRAIWHKQLRCVRIGRLIRVDLAEIERYEHESQLAGEVQHGPF